jgi:hypothetical protein
MLTCYLDDSGTTPDSPVITLAGFAGFAQGWEGFERSAKEIYCNYRITTLHAKEFFSSDGEFTGWSRIKKQTFAWEISKAAREARAIEIAITFSVRKEAHAKRKADTGLDSTSLRTVIALALSSSITEGRSTRKNIGKRWRESKFCS